MRFKALDRNLHSIESVRFGRLKFMKKCMPRSRFAQRITGDRNFDGWHFVRQRKRNQGKGLNSDGGVPGCESVR